MATQHVLNRRNHKPPTTTEQDTRPNVPRVPKFSWEIDEQETHELQTAGFQSRVYNLVLHEPQRRVVMTLYARRQPAMLDGKRIIHRLIRKGMLR